MTFLEKSAWIMTAALIVSGFLYFNAVMFSSQALGITAPPNIGLIAFATIVIVAFAIFGHVFAALGNPTDANAPEDERDKRVAQRAGNIAGWIQNISVFVGITHSTRSCSVWFLARSQNTFWQFGFIGRAFSHDLP